MTHPVTTAIAACSGAAGSEVRVAMLPAIADATGFAGAYTGIIDRRLFAGGGANFPDGKMPWNGGKKVWHDTLFMMDLSAPEAGWEIVGRLPKPNGYGVSLSTGDGIVLIGGSDAHRHFREVWLLTMADDGKPAFQDLPKLPVDLAHMSGARVGRRIHLCGGIEKADATRASNAHWMLDLDAPGDGWQMLPELPADGRILATAATLDHAFYLIGGCSLAPDAAGKPTRTLLGDAWKFSANRWTRIADLPHALAAAGSPAPVAGDAVFLVSGDEGSQADLASPADHAGFSKRVLRYDSIENRWSFVGELTLPPPVTVPVVPWNDAFIYFNGEVKPGVRTPQVFAFDPSTCRPAQG